MRDKTRKTAYFNLFVPIHSAFEIAIKIRHTSVQNINISDINISEYQ